MWKKASWLIFIKISNKLYSGRAKCQKNLTPFIYTVLIYCCWLIIVWMTEHECGWWVWKWIVEDNECESFGNLEIWKHCWQKRENLRTLWERANEKRGGRWFIFPMPPTSVFSVSTVTVHCWLLTAWLQIVAMPASAHCPWNLWSIHKNGIKSLSLGKQTLKR
jgi:hypothetical protein